MLLDQEAFSFIEQCDDYQSPHELLRALLEFSKMLGFEHLILSGVPVGGQDLAPMVELNGWPSDWFDRYLDKEYAKTDGVCLYSATTHRPFSWSEVPPTLMDTEDSQKVQNEAREFGIRSGFAVPFLSPNHWQSVVSFASPDPNLKLNKRERAQLVTVATFAGAAVEAMIVEGGPQVHLSDREKEVLLWIADGKSAWDAGTILNISEATVRFHLANIRRRLNVPTTIQAVVKAAKLRIISPS